MNRKSYFNYGLGLGTIRRYGLKIVLFVYDKAGRKCEKCGSENDLTIHHLNNKGRNYENKGLKPDNNLNNLVVWCRQCHGSYHGKQRDRGMGLSQEHRKKLSDSHKGLKNALGKHWKREPFSIEHRKKLSEAKKGKPSNNQKK